MSFQSLNNLAAQFAIANREEQEALRKEIVELREIIAAICIQCGGQIELYDYSRYLLTNQTIDFELFVDLHNRTTVIRLANPPTPPNAVEHSEQTK